MRLLAINPLWPHKGHSVRAANVVLYELLRELARQPEIQLGFLKLSRAETPPITVEEKEAIAELAEKGVDILPECRLNVREHWAGRWQQLLLPSPEHFYPDLAQRAKAEQAIEAFRPEALFVAWSEIATALYSQVPLPKYAYYGNPDQKSFLARTRFDREHGGRLKDYILRQIQGHHLERIHLGVMRQYTVIGDVAANDALYYRQRGLLQSRYIQNVWIDRFQDDPPALKPLPKEAGPIRIIANVGKLGGTANTYGLEYLATDVLPHLPEQMKGRPYEVHILGAGELHPHVDRVLRRHSHAVMRGFVDDIDEEMARSGIFVCVNNATPYNVGHTRYLHAWSLGCCVISHSAVSDAMPEIQHEKNALLGGTGAEIAAHIARAAAERELRFHLGQKGYETFREAFTAERVAPKIIAALLQ